MEKIKKYKPLVIKEFEELLKSGITFDQIVYMINYDDEVRKENEKNIYEEKACVFNEYNKLFDYYCLLKKAYENVYGFKHDSYLPMLKEYERLLKEGLSYKEIKDMIDYDYNVYLSKQRYMFEDNVSEEDIMYADNINSVIQSDVAAYNEYLSLDKAYKLVYKEDSENLKSTNN